MSTRAVAFILLLALVSSSAGAWAQDASPATRAAQTVDVDRLPLDLQRLERRLRQAGEQEGWDGFRLRYTVEVFGEAPKLRFFEPFEVRATGPIPYGAPTHREMIEVMTPREYRAPAMDFSALIRWLDQKLK